MIAKERENQIQKLLKRDGAVAVSAETIRTTCFQATLWLYRELFRNPLFCAGMIFALGAVAACLWCLATGKQSARSVFLCALLTGCMHGVNLILVCMIPPCFQNRYFAFERK